MSSISTDRSVASASPGTPGRRRLGWSWPDPAVLTVGLTLILAGVGAALTVNAPADPLLQAPTGWVHLAALVGLAVAFFVAELGQALVEVRRQAYSFSLSGVPLLLGLLYCPPQQLIAVRIAATMAAFAYQRAPALKFSFNTASYLLDSGLVLALSHLLVHPAPGARELTGPAGLDLRTAGLCYVALALVDLAMSALVVLVIRINQGPVSRVEVLEMFLPATAFVVLNTAVGFICAVLLEASGLGTVLLAVFLGVTGVVYRGYLVLRRRHQSLQVVQDFIQRGESAETVEDLAEELLSQVRVLVRASQVELRVQRTGDDAVSGKGERAATYETAAGDADREVRVVVDEDGIVFLSADAPELPESRDRTEAAAPYALAEPLLARCRRRGEALLLTSSSPDEATREWLDRRGVRDAIVVPLAHADLRGTLVALDRMGDSTSFSHDDVALLQTLAGHLAVAVQSRHLVQRLRYEATHDVLTGLPNRALLAERVTRALTRSGTPGQDDAEDSLNSRGAAVLLLDLDRFKEVNDALGHHVGDQLLEVVAARLRGLDLPRATVARLGGDEFAVLIPPGPNVAGDALNAAAHIRRALSEPVDLPDATVSTAASVGVALATPGQSHADLLRHADTAMYAAKENGSGLVVYSPDLDRGRAERLALLADLHLALDRDELHLHYQPKLDLAVNLVTSVEVLVRWTHPVLGPLGPDVFIPLAESTGLIEQLTSTVLTKALAQCAQWRAAGIDLAVAVNLSARNVNNPALPDQVAAALAAADVPPHKLILEITESSVMGDPENTVPTLERLADLGVTLSLDDFGTGYSSLSYLQRLPVREVKIDRSFVLGLDRPGPDARTSAALIRSIVGLGDSLGLRVVAEGVETAETLQQLRDLGCDIAQGYHLGRPVPAHQIPRHMHVDPHRPLVSTQLN